MTVWQKSVELVVHVYKLTGSFPREELYGLTSQLRRAAVSIPANIAEGNGRSTQRDYAHFLSVSLGSARELDTLLELAARLNFTSEAGAVPCHALLDEVCRMLHSLRSRLSEATNNVSR
jgi:four helix bundle protein